MIHIHARTPEGVPSLRGRGLPRDHRGDPRRGRRRDHQLLDRRDRRADREADRVPARAAAGRGRAEHELDELREVLAPSARTSSSRPCSRTRSTRSSSSSTAMNELGIRPEHECFDSGHVANLDPLIDMGLLSEPLQIRCVMGVTGGIRPDAAQPRAHGRADPGRPEGPQQLGRDRDQPRPVAAGGARPLRWAATCASGLEDNFYLPDGEMARSNGDLIAQARADRGGRRAGAWRRVAEARELLGTPRARSRGVSAAAARRRQGARPLAAAAGRLLLAAARRLRRRGAEGRGHRDGRLHPLVAARTTRAPTTRRSRRCSSR